MDADEHGGAASGNLDLNLCSSVFIGQVSSVVGQGKCKKRGVITSRSGRMKAFVWKLILESLEQGLFVGSEPSQPVTADSVGRQIHLGAHQSVNPLPVNFPGMPQ